MARRHKSRVPRWVRIVLLVPLPVIAVVVGYAGKQPREGLFQSVLSDSTQDGVELPVRLPLPARLPSADFRLADTIQVYDPDNLYVKINGHDVAFLRYGFVSLTFASYAGADSALIDVYAYRMNRRENALGIYAAERADDREDLPLADAGYISGGAVFFFRGPWYVQLIPSSTGETVEGGLTELVDTLTQLIPSTGTPPPALTRFPSPGRVVNSDGYFPDNAFGVDFLHEVFTTRYAAGKDTVTAFYHRSDSAGLLFERYCEFLAQNAEVRGTVTMQGITVRQYRDYGEQIWVFSRNDILAGLQGAANDREMEKLAHQLITACE